MICAGQKKNGDDISVARNDAADLVQPANVVIRLTIPKRTT